MARMTRGFVAAIALAISVNSARGGDLAVGFGSADVTPDFKAREVFLAGFGHNRKATEIHSRLHVRAVVLRDGDRKIAIASVDVVGLFLPFVERVRTRLSGFDYVLVCATHNHHGPDTMGLWGTHPFKSGVDPEYMKHLEDQIVAAVQAADAGAAAAEATVGTVKIPELLHDARDPQIKHDELVALAFRKPGGDGLAGIVVQWNCHPETLDSKNPRLSSDYVGPTCDALKAKYNCPVVYLTGTVGGLMTSMHVDVKDTNGQRLPEGGVAKTERFGILVAEATGRAIDAAVPARLTPFDVRKTSLLLPVDNAMYRLAKQAGVFDRAMEPWAGDAYAAPKSLDKLEGRPAVRTEVGRLRLGEVELAVIPGEIYPELVLGGVPDPAPAGADFPDAPVEPAIYASMKGKYRMIVGLGNDELGYILPKRQWDEKAPYTFGRTKPPYGEVNSLGPDTAPILCEAFRRLGEEKK